MISYDLLVQTLLFHRFLTLLCGAMTPSSGLITWLWLVLDQCGSFMCGSWLGFFVMFLKCVCIVFIIIIYWVVTVNPFSFMWQRTQSWDLAQSEAHFSLNSFSAAVENVSPLADFQWVVCAKSRGFIFYLPALVPIDTDHSCCFSVLLAASEKN